MKNVKTVRTFLISLAGVVCITSTIVFLTGPQSDEYDAHIPPVSKNNVEYESRVNSQPSLDYDPPEQIPDFESRVKSEPSVEYEPIVDHESRPKSEPSVESAQVIRLMEDVAAQSKALKEYVELVRNLNEEMISTKSALSLQIEERKKKVEEEEEMKVFRAASSKTTNVGSKDEDSKKGLAAHTDIDALLKQNYLGCHVDSFLQRDMPVYLPSFTQTPAKCMKACFDQGHKYAGLQNGGECWCGPDAPRQRRLDDISCRLPCSGDQSMMCGGELRNSVYKAVNIGLQNDTLLIKRPFELANAGSSVTCQGNNKDTRVCKFRNLYYDTSSSLSRNRIFIFYRGPGTIIINLEEVQNAKSGEFVVGIMELTSITGIIGMDIRVIDLPSSLDKVENSHDLPFLRYKDVRVVPGSSSLFARFLPFNIMHHLHDDLMNLFMTLVEFSSPHYSSNGVSTRAPFDTQTRLVVMDGHVAGGYSSLLQTLSDVSVTAISEISSVADNDARESSLIEGPSSSSQVPGSNVMEGGNGNLIQFETAVTGVTRHCNWYQYGFNIPQGPLEGKEVDGHHVRMFANFVLSRLPPLKTLPASTPLVVDARDAEPRVRDLKVTDPEQKYIAIFSRTLNRKILNEPELVEALEVAYPHLKVVIVRLEETPLPVLMRVIERTSIGIGMHGSILILALFMPKGSLLVEMYPYAVPAENYTPYKTLAGLKNMDMKYAAWENNYKENNIEYPNRPRLQGGVSHLAPAELKAVTEARWVPKHKCCEDPTWLFRIYQDTRVHVAEVLDLIRSKGM